MGGTGKKRFAVTVDELGGFASSRVDFIRTDARAAKRATPSNTHLKETLSSPFDVARGMTGPAMQAVIRELVTLRTAAPKQLAEFGSKKVFTALKYLQSVLSLARVCCSLITSRSP